MQDIQPQLRELLNELGISADVLARKALPPFAVAETLAVAETDSQGRIHLLTPEAAQAWQNMKRAAAEDGVVIEIVSAFRDLARQSEIIRNKLQKGLRMDHILTLSAPPGFSEHHTGRAVDINTPGCVPTEEPFEDTAAFRWLCTRAAEFGFSLSYPKGNTLGFIYEPWHWCYHPTTLTRSRS